MSEAETKASKIIEKLRSHGYEAFSVGGCVRDRLLDIIPHEVDVTTSATPDVVQHLFPRTFDVGAAFGVIIVMVDDMKIEVATFREDFNYEDGRRPSHVCYSDAKHDAQRRDFTINALLYDPVDHLIIDYIDGINDLKRKVVRAIGNPDDRFREDYLRMMRAVRFTARFDFAMDPATFEAIKEHARFIVKISPERLFDELTKILTGPNPHNGIELLDKCGLLRPILPEIVTMKGVQQPPQFHPEGDVWVHTLLLLENMNQPTPELAWSCLLHDVGKPPTFEIGKHGRESFPAHAKVGADMTNTILKRFKCSRAFMETVSEIVRYHMAFSDVRKMKRSTLRRMLARETYKTDLELHRLDCMSCHEKLDNYYFMLDVQEEFQDEPPMPKPFISGHDLIARGIPEGKKIGKILKELEELQLNSKITSREAALIWCDNHPDVG